MAWIVDSRPLASASSGGAHAATHLPSGDDALSGEELECTQAATNYTPADNTIGGHLSGVDSALGSQDEHADEHIASGSDEIAGEDLAVDQAVSYYTPDSSTLGGHLTGVDTALNARASTDHDATHIRAGSDEIDGDQIDIDYDPTYSTPDTTISEATHADHLSAHLAGLDNQIQVLRELARDCVGCRIENDSGDLELSAVTANLVGVFNGSAYDLIKIPSSALDLTTATDLDSAAIAEDAMYDVYLEHDGSLSEGNIVLKKWSSNTVIGYTPYEFDGVLVHENSDNGKKRRYLGCIYSGNDGSDNPQLDDDVSTRYIWNRYNQIAATVGAYNGTNGTWTYDGTSWRESNNGTNQFKGYFVVPPSSVQPAPLSSPMLSVGMAATGAGHAYVSASLNATNAPISATHGWCVKDVVGADEEFVCEVEMFLGGYSNGINYISTIEKSPDGATITFWGWSYCRAHFFMER